MLRPAPLALACLGLAWCGAARAVLPQHAPNMAASVARDKARSSGDKWRISMSGYGPVTIGMTPAQASAALGATLSAGAPVPPRGCHYLFAPDRYPGTYFMVSNGAIARIDFREPGPRTLSGIGVGQPEADVRKRFGARLQVAPHRYFTPDGHALTLRSKDGRHAVRFNTDHGRVKTFEIGRTPEIDWVDECS
jgi:hypothetical protein